MIWVGVSSLLPPPIWNIENGQWESQVVHRASAAAILTGWYVPSWTPSSLPTNRLRAMVGTSTMTASTAVFLNRSAWTLRRSCQAETPSMMIEPVTRDASRTWV